MLEIRTTFEPLLMDNQVDLRQPAIDRSEPAAPRGLD